MKGKTLAMVTIAVLASSACSKSESTSASRGIDLNVNAQFIDAPVNGLTYSIVGSTTKGKTSNNGNFSCKRGQVVRFEIGQAGKGLHLGNASCGEKIFIHHLDTAIDSAKINKIGAILQSMDDATDGKIVIPDAVSDLDFQAASIETDIDSIVNTDGGIASFVASTANAANVSLVAVTIVAAEAHIEESLKDNIDTAALDTLFAGITNTEITNVNNFSTNLANEMNVFKAGTGSCAGIDLDFYLGVKKTDGVGGKPNQYHAYGYATYDRTELIDGVGSPSYCARMDRDPSKDYDGECFAYDFGTQLITSNNLSIKTKLRNVDGYLENLSSNMTNPAGNWPTTVNSGAGVESIYDVAGSLYLNNGRLKGRILLTKDTTSSSFSTLPATCIYDIDQSVDDGKDEEDDEDLAHGSFAGQLTCNNGEPSIAASMTTVVDTSAPQGYKLTTMELARGPVFFTASNINLVNDSETPDDVPYLSFSQVESSVDYSILGYNNWSNGGYFLSVNYSGNTCEGILNRQ